MRSPRSSRPDGSWHSAEIFPAVGTQRCDQHWEFPRNTVATRRACRRGAVPRCPRFSCANAEDPVTSSAAIVNGCTAPARRIRAHNLAPFESTSPIGPSRLARTPPVYTDLKVAGRLCCSVRRFSYARTNRKRVPNLGLNMSSKPKFRTATSSGSPFRTDKGRCCPRHQAPLGLTGSVNTVDDVHLVACSTDRGTWIRSLGSDVDITMTINRLTRRKFKGLQNSPNTNKSR